MVCKSQQYALLCAIAILLVIASANMEVQTFSKMHDPRAGAGSEPAKRRTAQELIEQNRNKTILQENLMRTYKKFVPPAGGADCQIQLALYSIVEVSTALQTIKLQGWWRHYWKDERLAWDADLWGVGALVYNIEEIWTPDDLVYELIEEEHLGNVALTVYPSGDVFYSAPRVTTVGCKMFLSKYPYDIQTCQFTVGSMSFDGSLVDVLPRTVGSPDVFFEEASVYQDKTAIDLSQFRANKEFALTKVRIVSQNFYYNCCPEPYPVIVYEITIQRQTLTFLSGILIPIIAVTFVGFSVLLMPAPLSGARPSISISVMFTTTAIYLVASRKLPEVGEYTMIGRLYMASLTASLIMTFISIFTSAINLVVSEQNNNRADLLAVFRHYDSDRSGALSLEEADRALSALGLTEAERDYILAKHDMDQSDEISFDEWLRLGAISRNLRPTTQYSVSVSSLIQWLNRTDETPKSTASNSVVPELLPAPVKLEPKPEDVEAGGGAEAPQVQPAQPPMTRIQSLRSMGGKSFRLGAKRGDLGVDTVQDWLLEIGVDDKVMKRFEEEAIDVMALAYLPLEKIEMLGISKIGNQARLVAQAKDKLENNKRAQEPPLMTGPSALGYQGDPSIMTPAQNTGFHAVGVSEPQAVRPAPIPENAAEGVVAQAGEGSNAPKAVVGPPMRLRSSEEKKALKVHSKLKHLGAWVDCVSLIIFPLAFTIYIIYEFSNGLDFHGSAVDVETVKTQLELVDMRAEGEMCFANTQSIALPGSRLCPDVEIKY